MRGAKSAKWVVGAIVVAMAATACGGGNKDDDEGSAAVDPNGVFTYYNTEPQRGLIPTNTNEVGGHYMMANMFRGLVTFDIDNKLQMAQAQSVETTDNQHYTVKLKPGWKFHNGETVTANSFVKAWNWAANAKNAQLNSSWYEAIKGYEDVHPEKGDPKADAMSGLKVVNDNEFTIELSRPVSTFKQRLYYDAFFPLPEAFYKDPKAFGEHPIGNGPYKMEGSWAHKVELKVRKFADYKGDDKPKNGGIDFKFFSKDDAAYAELLSDKIDIMYQVPNSQVGKFQQDLGKRAISQPYGGNTNIGFPLYDKEWGKPEKAKVRQGLSMAIDRETIAKTALKGSKDAATGFTPKGIPGWQDGACGEYCKFDPAKAKDLIKQGGGVPGNKVTITYNADGANKEWVDAVCNDIRQNTGVECVTDAKSTFQESRDLITEKKLSNPFRMAWVMDFPNVANFVTEQFRTGAGANDMGYSNKDVDALMNKADEAKTPEEANKGYFEAEKKLMEDMPAIPLFTDHTVAGYSKRVQNVKIDYQRQAVWTEVEVKK
ncbi:peptide ABC transporter substrate-binding protein [Streptomyces mobaraensis]|uniref:ABC transporter substrate-binding protein n=1 Tax=Streptomyces mobaraensis TaxID=35621 RepID=A0A5N5WEI4_STRMB|nr:ABC transporter substrate-binding protein [Streptomyces mobaraensis]KAB7852319.1 ABC transporter substrate-binding protein [Streptomyces mobaraensis]